MTTLLSARDIRVIADSLGVRPTKQRGQNFVIDPNTVRMIVSAAKLAEGEEHTVLEVGPGLGSLTLGLLEVGHRVIAVEIDELLASRLPDTVAQFAGADAPFELICADALDVAELPAAPDALIANLPYNVAVPVLLHLLAQFDSIESVLVMVQKEVADRLAAPPGSRTYGVPSVKAQWYGTVEQAGRIGRSVFWPAPNVDSGLVRITRHAEPRTADRDAVFRVVDTAFAQRRKTLRAALSGWAGSGAAAEEILTAAGVDPKARGEVLTVDDFIRIAEARTAARGAAGQPAADGQSAARDSAGQPAADGQPTAGAAAET